MILSVPSSVYHRFVGILSVLLFFMFIGLYRGDKVPYRIHLRFKLHGKELKGALVGAYEKINLRIKTKGCFAHHIKKDNEEE